MQYKYLAVLDFEATCWKDSMEHEIIEFPTVIIDVTKRQIIDRMQVFVKPVKNPILSDFCKELTGISQELVDNGVTLGQALKLNSQFLSKYHPKNIMIVTCGNWDLKTMLPKEKNAKNLNIPSSYGKWINIKTEFCSFYKLQKELGMAEMLEHVKMPLLGRHHSGIDDCVNIAGLCINMIEKRYNFDTAQIQRL